MPLSAQEKATLATLSQEADDIEAASAKAEELTEEQGRRMCKIKQRSSRSTSSQVYLAFDTVVAVSLGRPFRQASTNF